MGVEGVLNRIERGEPEAIERTFDWLRIPSVSTDPTHRTDCRRAAEWARDQLAACGLEAELVETGTAEAPGHPMVMAEANSGEGSGPHVLFYGHYDVQPPDPLDEWESAPFDPVLREAVEGGPGERMVARGAVDDKGQVATFLEALRAWREETGEPAGGVRMTVMLEEEEESGSVNLARFLEDHAARLRADVCLISDTGMLGRGRPAITYGVRGLAYTEVTLRGPRLDLHSGQWGGRVLNPATELARILAQLHDENRRVTIPGFYEGVAELPDEVRAEWRGLGLDPAAALAGIGLGPEADLGEAGFTATEREWARPTAEVNGIYGGYTAPGAKTIIPAKATAKVSFRLVDEQKPARVRDLFFDWLRARTPPGFKWSLTDHGGGPPVTTPVDSDVLRAAKRALKRASGTEAALIKTGGSIPVAGMLKESLGLDTVFMGFGLDDDQVHAPNEKFELECFRLGMRAHAALIEELRGMRG